jgi:hypothetical protein
VTPAEKQAALEEAAGRAAIQELWRRGLLEYKLHDTQVKILESIQRVTGRQFFLLCSRRLGKSYLLVTMAFSLALRKPGARILYLAPWAKDAADIANDLAAQILEDCPAHLKPDYNAQAKEFHFKNGSIIRLKGVNGEHARFLRGGAADLIILDECGIMDELKAVIQNVCLPMTMTTGGRILVATTPAETPGHYSTDLYEQLAGKGSGVKFTLRDAPHVSDVTKAEFLREAGEDPDAVPDILAGKRLPETTTALREYFCEFVTDADSAVLPEFRRVKKDVVREWDAPPFADKYVAMDPGFKDRTGALFAYWDFRESKLVIEDEALLHHATTNEIGDAIVKKEQERWGSDKPVVRVSDIDLRLIADLKKLYGLSFTKAQKQDSLGAINLVRVMLQNHQIIIHPRCRNLIRQCENAIWNHKATDFQRPEDSKSEDGHYDLVAALKYLCRVIQRTRNPFPEQWYAPGGAGGPPENVWTSPKRAKARGSQLGLFGNTPVARKLIGQKRVPRWKP